MGIFHGRSSRHYAINSYGVNKMEDLLQAILAVVKDTPSIAIWVLAIFYGFKVVVVGSIYGVIRFCVSKIHDAIVANINAKAEINDIKLKELYIKEKELEHKAAEDKCRRIFKDIITIDSTPEYLIEMLSKYRRAIMTNSNIVGGVNYIHERHMKALAEFVALELENPESDLSKAVREFKL